MFCEILHHSDSFFSEKYKNKGNEELKPTAKVKIIRKMFRTKYFPLDLENIYTQNTKQLMNTCELKLAAGLVAKRAIAKALGSKLCSFKNLTKK